MTLLDLSSLPEPSFIDRDAATVTNDMVSQFETMSGKTLYPAQPERVEIDLLAQRFGRAAADRRTGHAL